MNSIGLVFCVLSAVFNGSFIAFAKIPSVARCELHPILFNAYVATGVFLSCWLVVPFLPVVGAQFAFTWFGFLAGSLFVGASGLSFVAASKIGLSTGQGTWSGAAVVVSFLWGALGPPAISKPLGSVALSAIAITLLLVGVFGIVKCDSLGAWVVSLLGASAEASAQAIVLQGGARGAAPIAGAPIPTDSPENWDSPGTRCRLRPDSEEGDVRDDTDGASMGTERLTGLVAALGVGILGGSILAPSAFAGPAFSGNKAINLLPSFGVGVMTTAVLVVSVWLAALRARGETSPPFHLRATLWAGLCSGLTWNLGNLCSILAINTFAIPFGVAYPLLQASLVVGGLLGIFVFKEIVGRSAIATFFVSAGVVLIAAIMLGLYGPGAHAHAVFIVSPPSPPNPPVPPPTPPAPPPTTPAPPSVPSLPTIPSPPATPHHEVVLPLAETTFNVLFLHFLGYSTKQYLSKERGEMLQGGLGFVAAHMALPALIFSSIAQLDLASMPAGIVLAIMLGKGGLWIVSFLIGFLAHPKDSRDKRYAWGAAFALWATNSDDIGLGVPIFKSIFPDLASLLFVLAALQALSFSPICYILMGIGRSSAAAEAAALADSSAADGAASSPRPPQKSHASAVLQTMRDMGCEIIKNKLVVSAVLGLVYNLIFGHELPWFLAEPTKTMGEAFELIVLLLGGMALVGSSKVIGTLQGAAVPLGLTVLKVVVFPFALYKIGGVLDFMDHVEVDDRENGGSGGVGFLFTYAALPSAASTLVLVRSFGMSNGLNLKLASAFAIAKIASLILIFAFAALSTFSDQLPAFVYIFSLALQGLSLVGSLWLVATGLAMSKWRRHPTYTRIIGLSMLQIAFPVAFLGFDPERIMGVDLPPVDRILGWALVSCFRWASEAWTIVLSVDMALIVCRGAQAHASDQASRGSRVLLSDLDAPVLPRHLHICVYIAVSLAVSLINTLPYMFSPYPTNPYMSLWILNQPMAFQEAISYGLASAALLVALFPLLLLGRDNSDPLLLRVTILCVFALVRTIGQCVMASTLSIQSLSAVPEGVQGAVAAQLVLTIAFGDGRGLCTFLLFGAMAEHYELLRRCRARFDVICRGSASARSTALRQTADIEGVHESESEGLIPLDLYMN